MAVKKAVKKSAGTPEKAAKKPAVKRKAAKKTTTKRTTRKAAPKAAKPAAAPDAPEWLPLMTVALRDVRAELGAEINALKDTLAPPSRPDPGADPDLDQLARSFRRMLAEALDQRAEAVAASLTVVHGRLAAIADDEALAPDTGEQIRAAAADLAGVLTGLGVEPFEPTLGEVFDPLVHLAVDQASADDMEAGRVCRVLGPGYRSARGRVLSPSRVIVSQG